MAGHHTHCLVLTDRGLGHVHRYAVACSCGWHGVHRRTEDAAAGLHRQHVNGAQARARRQARRRLPQPRPLTPREALPELLR